ncbi:MAG: hypothetical protein ACYSUB_20035 [Planctomycetota bacterium]
MDHGFCFVLGAEGVDASLTRDHEQLVMRSKHAVRRALNLSAPGKLRRFVTLRNPNRRHLALSTDVEPGPGLDVDSQFGRKVPQPAERPGQRIGILIILTMGRNFVCVYRNQFGRNQIMRDDPRLRLVSEHNLRRQNRLAKGSEVLLVHRVDLKTGETTRIELALVIPAPARIAKTLLIEPVQVIKITAVVKIVLDTGNKPSTLGQTHAPAPARMVVLQLAGLEVQERCELGTAGDNQSAPDHRQVPLWR